MKAEHLPGGQQGLEAKQLGEIPDLTPRLAVPERGTEHERFASGGPREPEQELHDRRLSCPVGTEEAEDLSASHRHRQCVHSDRVAEAFAEAHGVDGRRRGWL